MAFKKVWHWLYGVYFILKTDVNVFVFQFNSAGRNILGKLVVKQIAWIRFFDFKVKYILSKKHTAVDKLFKRRATQEKMKEKAKKENINDFIDGQLDSFWVFSSSHHISFLFSFLFLSSNLSFGAQYAISYLNSGYFFFLLFALFILFYFLILCPFYLLSPIPKARKKKLLQTCKNY